MDETAFLNEMIKFLKSTFSKCVLPTALTNELKLGGFDNENETLITGASQTLKPKVFEFEVKKAAYDLKVKIIDTPGLGDTRGHSQDEENTNLILEQLSNIDDLGGIVLIINGSVSRVSASVTDVITKLKGILPKNVFEKCFYLLFTNTDSNSVNFNTDWLFPEQEIKPKIKQFYVNNNIFSRSSVAAWSEMTKSAKERLCANWEEIGVAVRRLVNAVAANTTSLAEEYAEMRAIHSEFMKIFTATQASIHTILEKSRAIALLAAKLRNMENETGTKIKHKLKSSEVQVITFVIDPHYSTMCVDHVLTGLICHKDCSVTETPFSGDPDTWAGSRVFNDCTAIDGDGCCRECPTKCDISKHFHSRQIPKFTMVPAVNLQDTIFTEYVDSWKERSLIDNYKAAISAMRKKLIHEINELFSAARALSAKVFYFNFKKYIQNALDVMSLQLKTTSDVNDHDRLLQLSNVYNFLLEHVQKNDLMPLETISLPLIDGIMELDSTLFLDQKLMKRLDIVKNRKIVDGIDEGTVPKIFKKLVDRYLFFPLTVFF